MSIPQSGGKISKRLGGIIGCKYKTSSWHLKGFPDGSNIGSTVYTAQYNKLLLYFIYDSSVQQYNTVQLITLIFLCFPYYWWQSTAYTGKLKKRPQYSRPHKKAVAVMLATCSFVSTADVPNRALRHFFP